jgi:hypothetical protein
MSNNTKLKLASVFLFAAGTASLASIALEDRKNNAHENATVGTLCYTYQISNNPVCGHQKGNCTESNYLQEDYDCEEVNTTYWKKFPGQDWLSAIEYIHFCPEAEKYKCERTFFSLVYHWSSIGREVKEAYIMNFESGEICPKGGL